MKNSSKLHYTLWIIDNKTFLLIQALDLTKIQYIVSYHIYILYHNYLSFTQLELVVVRKCRFYFRMCTTIIICENWSTGGHFAASQYTTPNRLWKHKRRRRFVGISLPIIINRYCFFFFVFNFYFHTCVWRWRNQNLLARTKWIYKHFYSFDYIV